MTGVPIISTRDREVWTYENKRKLDRLAVLLHSADVALLLTCRNPVCPSPTLELVRDDTDPGGRILQCGCKRRYFEPRTSH